MDLRREPGAGIGRDISRGERADLEVDAFISRRHDRRVADEGERAAEAAWVASERLMEARRRAEEDRERLAVCRRLQDVYARRSAEWGRQGDALERREASEQTGDAA